MSITILLIVPMVIAAAVLWHFFGPFKYRHYPHLLAWTVWYIPKARLGLYVLLFALGSKAVFAVGEAADHAAPPAVSQAEPACAKPGEFSSALAGKLNCPTEAHH